MSMKPALTLATVAFVAHFAIQLGHADEPLGDGFESEIARIYTLPFVAAWREQGFIALKGDRVFRVSPTTVRDEPRYYGHPPLAHWLIHASMTTFGFHLVGMRMMPIICSALVAFFLTWIATRHRGLVAGIASILLYDTLPMVLVFGRMANYESLLLCLGLAAVTVFLEWRGGRRRWATLGLFFLAGFTDWPAVFVALVLVVGGLLRTKRGSVLDALTPLIGVSLGVALYLWLVAIWMGGADGIPELFTGTYRQTIMGFDGKLVGDFLSINGLNVGRYFGWGAIGLAAMYVIRAALRLLGRRGDQVDVHLVLWPLVTLLNIVVFPRGAWIHDFWTFYATPAVVLGASAFFADLVRRRSRPYPRSLHVMPFVSVLVKRRFVVALILFLGVTGVNLDRAVSIRQASLAGADPLTIKWAESEFDERSIVVLVGEFHPSLWSLRTSTWLLPVATPEVARLAAELHAAGHITAPELAIWGPAALIGPRNPAVAAAVADGARLIERGEWGILIVERPPS